LSAGDRRVLLGAIASAHGVRGLVKVKAFTLKPEDLVAYGPLSDKSGTREFRLNLKGRAGGLLLAAIDGVGTREAAERLRGTELYVSREALPPPEAESYYWTDLEGLTAVSSAGAEIGRVERVLDYGAGPVLQLRLGDGGEVFLPFSDDYVPQVDLGAGRIVVQLPPDVAGEDERPPIPSDGTEAADRRD
jgi:16S rRNA processing protein RimM